MNEWMNEWIYLFDRITVSQAGTPRHDNCVRLPVSWKTTIDYVVKTMTYRDTKATALLEPPEIFATRDAVDQRSTAHR